MNDARLFVISAPSGCGKGTLLGEVFRDSDVFYSISCTTRAPREGEVNGVHYHFITDEKFRDMIAGDEFLEYAEFVKHSYGTPRQPVLDSLSQGRDVILEIETKGAFQIKEKIPEAVLLFILPPSIQEIRRRLNKRGTEKADVIEKRVSEAAGEIAKSYRYDYVIMNDDLADAVRDFKTVYNAAKSGDGSADRFRAGNEDTKKLIDEVLENA
ncbi:MAG: guanylate kinase [Ruminococcus sp.]|nr:guanylate kinase [Ruminococcus sp.]